jgi:hypothetical protein
MFQLTDENLILHLNKIFDNYIPDTYFFTTMEWIPEDIHYDIWKDIYIEQLYHTKRFNVLNQFIFSSYDNFFILNNPKIQVIFLESTQIFCIVNMFNVVIITKYH